MTASIPRRSLMAGLSGMAAAGFLPDGAGAMAARPGLAFGAPPDQPAMEHRQLHYSEKLASIAEQQQVATPTFFGFIFKFALPFLLPVLSTVWFLFFRR